jgi:ABC-2 type transport system permease protein
MTALVRSELRKLRTVRTPLVVMAGLLVIAVLTTVAGTTGAGHGGNAPLTSASYYDVLRGPLSLLTGAVLVLGILSVAGEYRHGTVVSTYLVVPRRGRVVAAKALALAAVAGCTGVVVSAVTTALAVPLFDGKHVVVPVLSGETVVVVVGVALAGALYAAVGVGVGAAIRNQSGAITVALVWMLAVEGLLPNVLHQERLGRWLPWGTVKALTRWDGALPVAAGVALLTGYALVLLAVGTAFVERTDVA